MYKKNILFINSRIVMVAEDLVYVSPGLKTLLLIVVIVIVLKL